jgi:hypothetical protein
MDLGRAATPQKVFHVYALPASAPGEAYFRQIRGSEPLLARLIIFQSQVSPAPGSHLS